MFSSQNKCIQWNLEKKNIINEYIYIKNQQKYIIYYTMVLWHYYTVYTMWNPHINAI